ncbi:hypothetical protein LB503_009442 [Fusarium chuoi]|nr:hypothetical protein LB503_009442 [Fusarium chuoi]
MDPNLQLYRSLIHLSSTARSQRLQHLAPEEYVRVRVIGEREREAQKLEELIAGRDLVQVALNDPSQIIAFERIANGVARASSTLVSYIANFDKSPQPLRLDAWKLVYCDIYHVDGGDATLQEIYEARLKEEELQTPAARARELRARRNAKWMIPAIEGLSEDEKMGWADKDPGLMGRLYGQLRLVIESFDQEKVIGEVEQRKMMEIQQEISKLLSEPMNYQDILKGTGEQFGFVYYRSRELYQTRYNWNSVWSRIRYTSSPLRVTWGCIHCQGRDNWMKLSSLSIEHWPVFSPDEGMTEDEDLRKHFNKYCEENRSRTEEDEKKKKKKRKRKDTEDNENVLSPGILRNTFIVIPIEFVSGNLNIEEGDFYDPCWVWAYDADWDGSEEETVVDGETYQGRVKVAKWSLNSWFYAARWEGVSLRDMWLKAQQHPQKYWICYTKELEEWDHEPFV